MDDNTLFDPPPAADEPAGTAHGWTAIRRKKVTVTIEDEVGAAEPIVRPGQRDFFPHNLIYRWVWTPETGWTLSLYEASGPNRKANGDVGLMIVTERLHGAAPESWSKLPDWLYLAMAAALPNWDPPAAQLQPAEGAVEAVMAAADEPRVRADDDLERGRP
ncbi:hypothetical protein GBF35_25605 [Nonomuraea phyllanthi]|uniref:hypothetical protein n=1 Tax=Nonomuraea phyllanthi TaxID=2219224 RepID=UPI001293FAF5|nr:hypothetical protein [Nonomuraea phyllanthi]QFY09576.1 hypothetical protein GBF35_25605 [Nonomuraea phyllanthi]